MRYIVSAANNSHMTQVPGIEECFQLMEEYSMLPNIRRHSIVVAQVALQLIDGFAENEISPAFIPDKTLIVAGALLHDIAKTPCLKNESLLSMMN